MLRAWHRLTRSRYWTFQYRAAQMLALWTVGLNHLPDPKELALEADMAADCFDRAYKLPSLINMVLWNALAAP